ncbi:MAG: hypothetical protein ACO1RT_20755 [Planctomycetaceae bacterium]
MKPWLMVSDPRCGSTMLRRTLDRHPDLECEGEMFNTGHPWYVKPEPDGWPAAIAAKFNESSGWHVQRYQIPLCLGGWESLASMPGLRVIDLERLDLTAQYCSWKYAKLTGTWKDRGQVPMGVPWNQREYDEVTQGWLDGRKRVRYRLRGCLSMRLTYEDLASDFAAAIKRCLEFLEVAQLPLRPAMQKFEQLDPRSVFVGMPDEL